MFPIRDHNPSARTPFVTYALIAVNVAVFLASQSAMTSPAAEFRFFVTWGLVPQQFSAGHNWVALLTSMFLHGGFMHLAGNMLFLWVFGDNLEDTLGHLGYLGYYLACGAAAGLAQVWSAPLSPVPMVGASGAIAGILGGYLLLFPRARVDVLFILVIIFRIFPIPAWIVLGAWFALQLFSGVSANPAAGGVAYWAHAGGFVAGAAMMIPAWLLRGGPRFWTATHGVPPHPETSYARSGIPLVRRR